MDALRLIGRSRIAHVEILDPLKGFQPSIQRLEYRQDFFGIRSRINLERATRIKQVSKIEQTKLEHLIQSTQSECFFCPQNLEKLTPIFPGDPPRIRRGECWVFPNLYPFGIHHAVATLSEKHYLDLSQFHPRMISHNLEATLEYLSRIFKLDPNSRYPIWAWNHLPPSAASIIHPHTQILVDSRPTPILSRMISRSRKYFLRFHRNYWEDYLHLESKLGSRFICWIEHHDKRIAVLASFSPMGAHELIFLFPGISSLIQLDSDWIEAISLGFCRALRGYASLGLNSFNITSFSGPMDSDLSNHYWLSFRLISRPVFRDFYVGDTGFMERFQGEFVVDTLPEMVAHKLKSELES